VSRCNFISATKILVSNLIYGGSAEVRTPDHLIKSQITTVIHNNLQLIKDVISVICVINNKLQYCTYLWSSATNLQHYSPTPPLRGTPLLRYLKIDTIPNKIKPTLNDTIPNKIKPTLNNLEKQYRCCYI